MKEAESLSEAVRDPDSEPAETVQTIGIDEAKEAISARGRERGFVTSEDLLEGLPVEDLTPEQVEEFLTSIEDHLRQEGIDVVEVPAEEFEAEVETVGIRIPRDDELLKAPTND